MSKSVILLQHHRLWALTRAELRDLARRHSVKRGRNKQDTIDNLMDSGIVQQDPTIWIASYEGGRFRWVGYGHDEEEAIALLLLTIKAWNSVPSEFATEIEDEMHTQEVFIPSGDRL